jgi:hypothetical protein
MGEYLGAKIGTISETSKLCEGFLCVFEKKVLPLPTQSGNEDNNN